MSVRGVQILVLGPLNHTGGAPQISDGYREMTQNMVSPRPGNSRLLYLSVKNEYDSTSVKVCPPYLRKPFHGCFSKANEIQGTIRITSQEKAFCYGIGSTLDSWLHRHDKDSVRMDARY